MIDDETDQPWSETSDRVPRQRQPRTEAWFRRAVAESVEVPDVAGSSGASDEADGPEDDGSED